MFLTKIEPVKVKGELYGHQIEFNREKEYIKFISQFHEPEYIHFNQIESLEISFDKKRKLLWAGICTLLLFIGFFLLLIRIRLPPWKVHIHLKNQTKPINIRAWMEDYVAKELTKFLSAHIPVELTLKE